MIDVEDPVPIDDATTREHRVQSLTSLDAFVLAYDHAGRRILHQQFGRDKKLMRQWHYDQSGKLVKDVAYDKSGNAAYWFDVSYEGEGWSEKVMYSAPAILSYRIVATRDGNGRLSTAVWYDPTGKILRTHHYAYENCLLVHIDMGEMGECVCDYDARGNLLRRSITSPGASERGDVTQFEYDDRGLLMRMTRIAEATMSFAYTFF
ncbi:MAG TPA: RHS repeat domain-containing protein [Thermoanaerobaculia bacterium]|nr:RHS repeat domain-containing protein [Thermoanaerobaculia bacterium]